MLTIGQLASYAGTTVRAIRHYHGRGLLAEPERDHSGYRRYDAAAVVDLIRIRTLADAGVPLARVGELLAADEEEFNLAVVEIDRRLRSEIRQRQRHRERIAQLAAGDSLALPVEAVAYLEKMRGLGFSERFVAAERDAWILVAAQLPEHMATYMSLKLDQLDDPDNLALLDDLAAMIDWEPTDPRLTALADQLAAVLHADYAAHPDAWDQWPWPPELVDLLDSFFLRSVPAAPRILDLLEQRGWRGWTRFEPIEH